MKATNSRIEKDVEFHLIHEQIAEMHSLDPDALSSSFRDPEDY